jgi:hypothetical protein
MYLYALFCLILATLLGLTWLEVTTAGIVTSARHVAARYVSIGLERAQDDLMESIAAQVVTAQQSGAGASLPLVAPTPGPPIPACAQAPCAFAVSTTVALAGQTQNASGGNVVALNDQLNSGVGEQRVAATVTATAADAGGAVISSATRRVVLRVFAVPPYVALSSSDEPTVDNGNVEDFAGTCDGSTSCGGVDNRIHALLRCSDPANPSACSGLPDQPVDSFSSNAWQNADAAPPAWSR